MTDYLLDTNHVTRLLSGDPPISQRVREHQGEEHGFGISMTILGELFFAIEASRKRDENLTALETSWKPRSSGTSTALPRRSSERSAPSRSARAAPSPPPTLRSQPSPDFTISSC